MSELTKVVSFLQVIRWGCGGGVATLLPWVKMAKTKDLEKEEDLRHSTTIETPNI